MHKPTTYLQAIESILRDAHKPLNEYEITEHLRRKYPNLIANAKTPETAVRARISEDIKKKSDESKFIRVEPNSFDLKERYQDITIQREPLKRSFFLVIEGLDGSGKTEVAYQLAQILKATHGENVMLTFEPHDPSAAGYFIRQALASEKQKISSDALSLAFAVNRADHFERVIKPFLESGDKKICICDRYYLSSLVYQASTHADIEKIMSLNWAAGQPDLTLFLNASTSTCYSRMKTRGQSKELFEVNLDRSREKYLHAIEYLRSSRNELIVEIDADQALLSLINSIGEVLTGAHGTDWIAFQKPLEISDPSLYKLSLNGNKELQEFALQYSSRWRGAFNLDDESMKQSAESLLDSIVLDINKLGYQDLGSLFTDYLRFAGYEDIARVDWTEFDAFSLKYPLPDVNSELILSGVAVILGSMHKQYEITTKVLDTTRFFDFMIILDLRLIQRINRFRRDPLPIGDKALPPSTTVINRKHIAELVAAISIKQSASELGHNFHLYKPKINTLL